MKINKISLVTGIVGVIISISSYIRWSFIWNDPSQSMLGVAIGVIITGGAYLYNWMKMVDEKFTKQSARIDALLSWWTKQEFK